MQRHPVPQFNPKATLEIINEEQTIASEMSDEEKRNLVERYLDVSYHHQRMQYFQSPVSLSYKIIFYLLINCYFRSIFQFKQMMLRIDKEESDDDSDKQIKSNTNTPRKGDPNVDGNIEPIHVNNINNVYGGNVPVNVPVLPNVSIIFE